MKSEKSDKTPDNEDRQDPTILKREFSSRLRGLLDEKGLTQLAVCQKTGISTSKMSDYANGRTLPSADSLIELADFLDVRPSWLVMGRGNRTEGGEDADDLIHYVPILDMQLAAGHSAWNPHEITNGHLALSDDMVRGLGKKSSDGLFVVWVRGDSGEPMLHDGDPILIDANDTRIHEGLFAFRIGDDLKIKKLRKIGLNAIEAISINPFYPPEQIQGDELEHFAVIGRVRYVWKRL